MCVDITGEKPDAVGALMSAPALRRSLATAMALRSLDRPATAEAAPAENSPPLTACHNSQVGEDKGEAVVVVLLLVVTGLQQSSTHIGKVRKHAQSITEESLVQHTCKLNQLNRRREEDNDNVRSAAESSRWSGPETMPLRHT